MMDEDWVGAIGPYLVGSVAEPDKDLKKLKKEFNILSFLMIYYLFDNINFLLGTKISLGSGSGWIHN